MTGTDRLRALAGAWDEWGLGGALMDVADEIERERACDADTIENLRLELGEARDDAAWVREHGGLDAVKKLLDWVVGHCSTRQQLDFDFWLSGRVMHELGFEEDMADRDEVERRLLARLMPEGMEWPMVDGEPVVIGERLVGYGSDDDGYEVVGVRPTCGWVLVKSRGHIHRDGGPVILEWDASKCHRPAPKVLDADGVEIRVGDTVCGTRDMEPMRVVDTDSRECGFKHIKCEKEGDGFFFYWADELTHKLPVLAADGRPLREGEHVYHVETGAELVIKKLPKPGEYQAVVVFALPTSPASHLTSFDPDQLTHRAPVLAADGKPLEVGQTVYVVSNGHGPFHIDSVESDGAVTGWSSSIGSLLCTDPANLTHERPVLDADGNRIEPSMDVWWVCEGDERGIHSEKLHVESIGDDGLVTCSPFNGGTWVELESSELYVNKPVLAADGEPLREGETVWDTLGNRRFKVLGFASDAKLGEFTVKTAGIDGMSLEGYSKPSDLTHERPVADTWERLEEDACSDDCEYFGRDMNGCKGCPASRQDIDDFYCDENEKARDLVRRARALAGGA